MSAAQIFAAHRSRLVAIGYRILGSRVEAEDCVQDAWLRFSRVDATTLDSPAAWLTTTVSRLCLDALRARKVRQETYVGPWLPEPWPDEPLNEAPDGAAELELADDLSMAFLLLLERLAPDERAAFLLHDVFDVPYPEIARTLGKGDDAVRQIVSRARKRVAAERPRFRASPAAQRQLAQQFMQAVLQRDDAALASIFQPDAVLVSDGGGKVQAALRPITGAAKIAKFFLGITRDIGPGDMRYQPGWMNGGVCILVFGATGVPVMALGFDVRGERIDGLYAVSNPDKLARLSTLPSGTADGFETGINDAKGRS